MEEYPTAEMRWGLAATAGSISSAHEDSHGRGTYVYCVNKNGRKVWIVFGKKNNNAGPAFKDIHEICDFYCKRMPPSKDEFPDVQVEAVLLQPGMRL